MSKNCTFNAWRMPCGCCGFCVDKYKEHDMMCQLKTKVTEGSS